MYRDFFNKILVFTQFEPSSHVREEQGERGGGRGGGLGRWGEERSGEEGGFWRS